MKPFKLQYWARNDKGEKVLKSIDVTVEAYKHAAQKGMTLRQYANYLAPDCDRSMGEPLDQMFAQSGLFDQKKFNMPGLTLQDLASETLADGFRRPDGSDNSLGARLLYPQLILETLQLNSRAPSENDLLSIWESLIAVNRNINSTLAVQPTIDTSAPEGSRSGRVAQLAEPETIVSITVGDKSYRVPTNSIGLLISDEAMAATSIDLVRVVMEAQAYGDRVRRVAEQLRSMVLGDVDAGIAALPVTKISEFDASIATNGTITKRAYIKWLHSMRDQANLNNVMTDIDTALTMDEQFLPKVTGTDAAKIMTPWGGMNLGITQPKMIPFKPEVFGAGLLVGLDSASAIQRIVNIGATYDAIEEYVMRKATAFRVDYGEMATRLRDESWSVVSLEA